MIHQHKTAGLKISSSVLHRLIHSCFISHDALPHPIYPVNVKHVNEDYNTDVQKVEEASLSRGKGLEESSWKPPGLFNFIIDTQK